MASCRCCKCCRSLEESCTSTCHVNTWSLGKEITCSWWDSNCLRRKIKPASDNYALQYCCTTIIVGGEQSNTTCGINNYQLARCKVSRSRALLPFRHLVFRYTHTYRRSMIPNSAHYTATSVFPTIARITHEAAAASLPPTTWPCWPTWEAPPPFPAQCYIT